jgi:hypothetical protein
MYRYARASLLHYARWMLENERPYLETPERLEYPTETWAAQDIRKGDIFFHAARHAERSERDRFLERAEFFYRYAVDALSGMPSRTLCRPVAIMMGNGYMRNWFALHPDEAAPQDAAGLATPLGDDEFGEPEIFVPQKVRALRRAKALVAGGGLAALGVLLYLILA